MMLDELLFSKLLILQDILLMVYYITVNVTIYSFYLKRRFNLMKHFPIYLAISLPGRNERKQVDEKKIKRQIQTTYNKTFYCEIYNS